MRAEFSHDAITKDGTTKVQKEARTIKQLICVTSQLRICLVAFMLLQVWKETKYSMEGNKQNIQWLPQKKPKQPNKPKTIQGSLKEGTDESKEQAKELWWRPSLEGLHCSM